MAPDVPDPAVNPGPTTSQTLPLYTINWSFAVSNHKSPSTAPLGAANPGFELVTSRQIVPL